MQDKLDFIKKQRDTSTSYNTVKDKKTSKKNKLLYS